LSRARLELEGERAFMLSPVGGFAKAAAGEGRDTARTNPHDQTLAG
jgi:hypothetical protein